MESADRSLQRVSDADRDAAASALKADLLAGRLTLEEFSQRVERAYAGTTANSSDITQRFGKGMQGKTLDSVRQGLDDYYAANPTMVQHPVIETLWFQMVVPGLKQN